jgi:hypothetical protein
MTSETRLFIEPNDILGIQLECTECGTGLSLGHRSSIRAALERCPSCQTRWLELNTPEHTSVQNFLSEVEALDKFLQGRKFKLTIEINRLD